MSQGHLRQDDLNPIFYDKHKAYHFVNNSTMIPIEN
jgi:hypothetical protein